MKDYKKIVTVWSIEDSPIITFLLKKTIKRLEYPVNLVTFNNGEQALDFYKEQLVANSVLPNVILMDLNMPVMDGWEFLEELQHVQQANQIPTYILTSSINPDDKIKTAQYSNVQGFISKPISDDCLFQILEKTKGDMVEAI